MTGLRADWTCELCKRKERTYQLVSTVELLYSKCFPLTHPAGWTVSNAGTFCASCSRPAAAIERRAA